MALGIKLENQENTPESSNDSNEQVKLEVENEANLKKQEESRGFKEAPKNNNKFFNLGPKNDWKSMFDKSYQKKIRGS